jgi:hypothetical protein
MKKRKSLLRKPDDLRKKLRMKEKRRSAPEPNPEVTFRRQT